MRHRSRPQTDPRVAPTVDLRKLDHMLLAVAIILSAGLWAGSSFDYAKRARFTLCGAECGAECGVDPAAAPAWQAGRAESELKPRNILTLFLPRQELDQLSVVPGEVRTIYRDSAGAAVELSAAGPSTLAFQESVDGESSLLFSGFPESRFLRIEPMPIEDPHQASRCRSEFGSLELVWPTRSILAWMVPALRKADG